MTSKNICVIGLGYVGLTLSVVLAEKGFTVFGVERHRPTLETLKNKKAHFFEKGLNRLLDDYVDKKLFLSGEIPADKQIDAFVITVGTPLDKKTKKPIMDFIIETSQTIAENLKDGQLVILRSTVPVGTTRGVVLPILEKTGKKFFLAFCPERTTEGVALKELKELPQIIGALNEESLDKAMDIFRKITPTTVDTKSLEAAEINKMLDNAYRDLIFACANEIALIAKKLGLDGYELIKAGNLGYERRVHIPVPGFVGGACLEKDPWIFIDCISEKTGYLPKLIKTARELNEHLPYFVVERVKENLKKNNVSPNQAKIFISGFAFKGRPATDDLRGSPTLDLLNVLKAEGFTNICGHDFLVKPDKIEALGVKPVGLLDGFKDADAVLFMTNNLEYGDLDMDDFLKTMKKGGLFFDGWHTFDPGPIRELNYVVYEGLAV